jgi:hypothetical protein
LSSLYIAFFKGILGSILNKQVDIEEYILDKYE